MTPVQKALIVLIVNYIKHLKQNQTMEKRIKIENKTAMPHEEEPTKLVEILEIPGTPFSAIKDNNQNAWFIAWGKYKLSPNQDTYKECVEVMKKDMWQIIATYTIAIMQEYETNIRKEIKEMIEQ